MHKLSFVLAGVSFAIVAGAACRGQLPPAQPEETPGTTTHDPPGLGPWAGGGTSAPIAPQPSAPSVPSGGSAAH